MSIETDVRECCECGGEGGWFDRSRFPAMWKRCTACYGFGLRSLAADRWFKRLDLSLPTTPVPVGDRR